MDSTSVPPSTTSAKPCRAAGATRKAAPSVKFPRDTALVSRTLFKVVFEQVAHSSNVRAHAQRHGVIYKDERQRRQPRASVALLALRMETGIRYFSREGAAYFKPATLARMFGKVIELPEPDEMEEMDDCRADGAAYKVIPVTRQMMRSTLSWLETLGIIRGKGDRGRWTIDLPASNKLEDVLKEYIPVPAAAVFAVEKDIDFFVLTRLHEYAESLADKPRRDAVLPLMMDIEGVSKRDLARALRMGFERARQSLDRLDLQRFIDVSRMRLKPKDGTSAAWNREDPFDMLKKRQFAKLMGEWRVEEPAASAEDTDHLDAGEDAQDVEVVEGTTDDTCEKQPRLVLL